MNLSETGMNSPTASGLDGVVVARTALSDVDGERGRLVIRGCAVEDLVERATFEDACGLLWNAAWPSPSERAALRATLSEARQQAFTLVSTLGDAFKSTDGMEALRAAVGHLRATDQDADRLRLTGAMPVFAAAWARERSGRPVVPPQPGLSHAADYLQMMTGQLPDQPRVAALDAYLCCVVDHGMNASTFVARVVASTGSDLVSAVVAAIGALKGPLHGGAPGPVLDMLDAIGHPGRARAWLQAELEARRRVMGMGHRIYRVRDPRAAALERAMSVLERSETGGERLALARAVEREAERLLAERHPERSLRANVEFYTAVLLDAIGIPRTLFAPTFAASRVVGWCAHVDEQRRVGRLIRPASTYIGPAPAAGAHATQIRGE
jgi:citrate synthase